jgi:dihydroorotate dehydrogenase
MIRAAGGLVAGGLGAYGLTTEAWRSSGVFLAVADTVGMPLLRSVDAEFAHRAAVVAAKMGLTPIDAHCDSYDRLRTRVLGIDMSSPVGLAAGFDKDAEGIVALLDMGFAAVEVGVRERVMGFYSL